MSLLLKALDRVDRAWDASLEAYHGRYGYRQAIHIVPYHGFGTPQSVWLEGRVLADRGIHLGDPERGPWLNFVDMMKRYASYEVPGAKLVARFEGRELSAVTDREGFYQLQVEMPSDLVPELWHELEIELISPLGRTQQSFRIPALFQVPPHNATIGVISDIDDTILHTGATNLLRHVRTVLFNSAHTRTPFEGVAAFYRALQRGHEERPVNPIWYLSSSPWNIYDLLDEFMRLREIPRGTILLKDFGINEKQFIRTSHRVHKLGWISKLIGLYPSLRFVLIGDTGQRDAEIYREAVEANPGRIAAVYLRDVPSPRRVAAMEHAAAVRAMGVDAEIVATTAEAAASAERAGLIPSGSVSTSGDDGGHRR